MCVCVVLETQRCFNTEVLRIHTESLKWLNLYDNRCVCVCVYNGAQNYEGWITILHVSVHVFMQIKLRIHSESQ